MADITAFPSFNPSEGGDLKGVGTYTAGAAITAGQVVAFATTGVSKTVHPAVSGTTGQVIGVALYTVASGAEVAVAEIGSKVLVANDGDSATIDAGDWVEVSDNAVCGTVSVLSTAATTTQAINYNVIGVAIEDIAASSYGLVIVNPILYHAPYSA